ncbi:hypothetical protein CRG98_047498 [Punica granatum]|uniref:Reverse transcriptase Ty1/copia-type domain-containing protein n=1 Tax=Punica granatum TaxID=22663 RepID=A0A2I0HK47_PUNGR|nr:hypothetical protein CRG98_047498 [Punica granatum]
MVIIGPLAISCMDIQVPTKEIRKDPPLEALGRAGGTRHLLPRLCRIDGEEVGSGFLIQEARTLQTQLESINSFVNSSAHHLPNPFASRTAQPILAEPDIAESSSDTRPHLAQLHSTEPAAPVNLPGLISPADPILLPPIISPAPSHSPGTSHHLEHYLNYSDIDATQLLFLAAIDSDIEPMTYSQAAKDTQWRLAMADEIRALEDKAPRLFNHYLPGRNLSDANGFLRLKDGLMALWNVTKLGSWPRVSLKLKASIFTRHLRQ